MTNERVDVIARKKRRRHLITTLIALRPEKPPPLPTISLSQNPDRGDRVANVPRKVTPRLRINRPPLLLLDKLA